MTRNTAIRTWTDTTLPLYSPGGERERAVPYLGPVVFGALHEDGRTVGHGARGWSWRARLVMERAVGMRRWLRSARSVAVYSYAGAPIVALGGGDESHRLRVCVRTGKLVK